MEPPRPTRDARRVRAEHVRRAALAEDDAVRQVAPLAVRVDARLAGRRRAAGRRRLRPAAREDVVDARVVRPPRVLRDLVPAEPASAAVPTGGRDARGTRGRRREGWRRPERIDGPRETRGGGIRRGPRRPQAFQLEEENRAQADAARTHQALRNTGSTACRRTAPERTAAAASQRQPSPSDAPASSACSLLSRARNDASVAGGDGAPSLPPPLPSASRSKAMKMYRPSVRWITSCTARRRGSEGEDGGHGGRGAANRTVKRAGAGGGG